MPEVLVWRQGDARDAIRRAVSALAQGQLVALPTETGYGLFASALLPEAVEQLRERTGFAATTRLSLAVRGAGEALDWVPDMSVLGRRLARRCWPGPVTLVFEDAERRSPSSRLPEAVRHELCPGGTLSLRTPAHEAALQALEHCSGPLVLSSVPADDQDEAATADDVLRSRGGDVALVIDDGPSR